MEELRIDYTSSSKNRRIANIVIFSFFTIFGLYIAIKEYLANNYTSVLFIGAAILTLLAVVLLLSNTILLPAPLIYLSNEKAESNLPGQKKVSVDWVNVSNVNIGQSYIVFFVNGGVKQKKLDLSELKYSDMLAVKSRIIELCEHKNISYRND